MTTAIPALITGASALLFLAGAIEIARANSDNYRSHEISIRASTFIAGVAIGILIAALI